MPKPDRAVQAPVIHDHPHTGPSEAARRRGQEAWVRGLARRFVALLEQSRTTNP